MKNKLDDLLIRLYSIMPKNLLPDFFISHIDTITERRKKQLQSEVIRLQWDLIDRQKQLEKLHEKN